MPTGNVYLNANLGWSDAEFELTPGIIGPKARHVFVSGHCHSLALAIHEATGWDVIGDNWRPCPGHVAVRIPDDGSILDIQGKHDPDTWENHWGTITDLELDVVYDAFDGDYREPDVDAASYWVRPVIEAYAPEYLYVLDSPFVVVGSLEVSA